MFIHFGFDSENKELAVHCHDTDAEFARKLSSSDIKQCKNALCELGAQEWYELFLKVVLMNVSHKELETIQVFAAERSVDSETVLTIGLRERVGVIGFKELGSFEVARVDNGVNEDNFEELMFNWSKLLSKQNRELRMRALESEMKEGKLKEQLALSERLKQEFVDMCARQQKVQFQIFSELLNEKKLQITKLMSGEIQDIPDESVLHAVRRLRNDIVIADEDETKIKTAKRTRQLKSDPSRKKKKQSEQDLPVVSAEPKLEPEPEIPVPAVKPEPELPDSVIKKEEASIDLEDLQDAEEIEDSQPFTFSHPTHPPTPTGNLTDNNNDDDTEISDPDDDEQVPASAAVYPAADFEATGTDEDSVSASATDIDSQDDENEHQEDDEQT